LKAKKKAKLMSSFKKWKAQFFLSGRDKMEKRDNGYQKK